MADGPENTDADTTPASTTPETDSKNLTFSQAEFDKVIDQRLARERAKYADYDDLKTAAQKAADEKKTELERLSGERDDFKGKAETVAHENLRLRVGLEKGLPKEFIDRLQGDTKDALEADADVLLKYAKAPSIGSGFDGGARGNGQAPQTMNDLIRRKAGR